MDLGEIVCMKVNYNKLWKLLIDKNMNRTELKDKIGMGSATLAKMGRNEPVSMDIIMRICEYFSCDIGDIMEMIPREEEIGKFGTE